MDDKFRLLLDTAPDAFVVVRRDATIDLVNRQAEMLFARSRLDLVGQPLETLIPPRFRSTHFRHVERYFAQPATRPMGSGMQLYGLRSDGQEIPIEVSLSPLETSDGPLVSAAIRDITERLKIEAAARLSAERLASAVEIIQDAFALYDAQDRLVLCNSAYRGAITASMPGAFLGRTLPEVFESWSPEVLDAPEGEPLRRWVRDRSLPRMSFLVGTRDGRSFRVFHARTPEGGTAQTLWDLTETTRREEELQQARGQAEAGSRAKSDFLASMSHELRTPMNAILGFAQLLQRDRKEPLSKRQIERVEHILRGGEHLLRLIDDVLDLARIEAGGVSISIEPVSVSEAVEEAIAALAANASRAGIRIAFDPPAEAPMVAADRTRLVQILINFGSNALKYNRPDGSVVFSIAQLDGRVRVSVADTGMGIPLDKQSTLFQPFQRAGQETGPIEGTGIGLALTRRLAQLIEGDVGFESTPGEGSTFWVEVPLQEVADEVVPARAEVAPLSLRERRLVLYVEDNPANVTFMRDLLDGFDEIDLVTAGDAERGVELARQRLPHVVLMDINLPGMSGLDALRVLRELPETRHIPVVALTAAASERDRILGEQAGFYRYLTKPVKVAELEACLAAILGMPEDARGA